MSCCLNLVRGIIYTNVSIDIYTVRFEPTTHHMTHFHLLIIKRAQRAIEALSLDSKTAICNTLFLMREENERKKDGET